MNMARVDSLTPRPRASRQTAREARIALTRAMILEKLNVRTTSALPVRPGVIRLVLEGL